MRSSSTGDRRSFIKAAGRFIGGTVAAGTLLSLGPSTRGAGAKASEMLIQPPERRSAGGILDTTITAAPGPVRLGSHAFTGLLYESAYAAPTLRARLGDTLQIDFRNRLAYGLDVGGYLGPICSGTGTPSNLHFHGMSVSPQGDSDNVFVHVQPGEAFQYRVRIPVSGRQGPGLFWYHPHAHGFVNDQILNGLSGALVVEGMDALFPLLRGLPERLFLIKHAKLADDSEIVSINGQLNPAVVIRPGEMQFWRIANIGASDFYKLRIEGMPLYVVATDGHALSRPQKMTELFFGPGERIEAIVVGPPAGEYKLRTVPFQNEAWRLPEPGLQLALIVSDGSSARTTTDAEILNQRVLGPRWIDDIRTAAIARRRTVIYSRTADRKTFMIDDRVVDEKRTDQIARLGDTEEWTVVNMDQQYHSFHIHQTAFVVMEVDGASWNHDSLHDTFSVPPATDKGPGVLKVLIPFTDPVIVGRFVYHCHAVDHEDKGMMGIIEVRA